MKNELQIFKNAEFGEVRTLTINNELYFVGKDVADILGYTNTAKAIQDHVENEDKLTERIVMSAQNRDVICINESGLYSLILSSKMPNAKKFKCWVTSEVLPSIRRTGGYVSNSVSYIIENETDFAIKALTAYKEEKETRMLLEAKIEQDKHKVAFAEAVDTATNCIGVNELAKLLKQNNIEIGEIRLFKYLRDNNYLIKAGSEKNIPTQHAMKLGLFELKERVVTIKNENYIKHTTKVTPKGVQYFINHFIGGYANV